MTTRTPKQTRPGQNGTGQTSPGQDGPGSTPSLTERYVHAATRRLPEEQRDDVRDELSASVADRVDALQDQRPELSREQAEYAALEELGEPARLAAGYTGRRLQLIGPEVYPAYVCALKAILVVAVPAATILVAIVQALTGDSVGAVVGGAVSTAFTVTVQVAFWTTLVFVVVERSGESGRAGLGQYSGYPLGTWSPDGLPDLPRSPRDSLGDLVPTVVFLGLVGGAIVWQQFRSPVEDGGERLPLLDPSLWSFWLPLILVLIAAEIAFEVVKYRLGRWTPRTAGVNVLIGAVFAAPLIYLAATDRLLNPAAVAAVQEEWAAFDPGVANTVVIITSLLIWGWDSVEGWLKIRGS